MVSDNKSFDGHKSTTILTRSDGDHHHHNNNKEQVGNYQTLLNNKDLKAFIMPVTTTTTTNVESFTVKDLIEYAKRRDPHEKEFLQALEEIAISIRPLLEKPGDNNNKYMRVMKRCIEPERIITFRVPWMDDKGVEHVNRGYRVQFNSALGPYKGGLRFHPSVNLSILKFLGFEQIFKNALTDLPMGGGKGGSDFDPKGKSDGEIMRFCQAFMTELSRYIGPDTDVPAGDIGVGTREIGYMFGQYKKLKNEFTGVLTGKGLSYGGSNLRPEATGYGLVFFLSEMMKHNGESLENKVCVVSGSGNVSQYAVEKLIELNAKVITMSDSNGYIWEPDGFTREQLEFIKDLKNEQRGRIKEYLNFSNSARYYANEKPWRVKCDVACPCATQNEIEFEDALHLVQNGCRYVVEGANMPSTNEAVDFYLENKVWYGPAKAANAGGVAVSGLEMSQNSMRLKWSTETVNDKLAGIMSRIFEDCRDAATNYGGLDEQSGYINIQMGANIAGFLKLADAMIQQGCV